MAFFDGLGSALVSGGLSFLGGSERNQSQEAQASAQMAFQRELSNSAYQRQVADLKAAGINPMLAAKLGGASTPQGAQAQIQDAVSPAVQAFQAQRMNSAQVANIQADTENKKATNDFIRAQTAQANASAWKTQADQEFVTKQIQQLTAQLEHGLPEKTANLLEQQVLLYRAQEGQATSQDLQIQEFTQKLTEEIGIARATRLLKEMEQRAYKALGDNTANPYLVRLMLEFANNGLDALNPLSHFTKALKKPAPVTIVKPK